VRERGREKKTERERERERERGWKGGLRILLPPLHKMDSNPFIRSQCTQEKRLSGRI